ncbi:MAG: hypothetical protein IH586_00295, partial [Anaerolineaceae bacterium]|nr:hypothetical protein [Anaerolineaceae bacterium]
FNYASENPTGASLSLNLRSTLKTSQAYLDTASLTYDWMGASEFALQQLEDLAIRSKNLALAGLNDTLGADERISALAVEVNAILNEAVDVSNTNHKGQYIFAGFQINTAPIELQTYDPADPRYDPANPGKQHAEYLGDSGIMQRSLGPSQSITMNMNANSEIRPFLDALIDIRDALNNNDTTALRTALGLLETSVNGLDQMRTSNGARQRQVTSSSEYLEKTQIELSSLLSQNEDANMAETISLMRNQEITYQAVLEVGSRAISALNLFEYLR